VLYPLSYRGVVACSPIALVVDCGLVPTNSITACMAMADSAGGTAAGWLGRRRLTTAEASSRATTSDKAHQPQSLKGHHEVPQATARPLRVLRAFAVQKKIGQHLSAPPRLRVRLSFPPCRNPCHLCRYSGGFAHFSGSSSPNKESFSSPPCRRAAVPPCETFAGA
jgi:hypothetical protein